MEDFREILVKIKRKVSCSPRKLPPLQIRQSLTACQDISSVNNLLKYSGYDEDLSPSLTMSLIMLKRIIIILNGPWRLTDQDWIDIKNSFYHIRLKLDQPEQQRQQVHQREQQQRRPTS